MLRTLTRGLNVLRALNSNNGASIEAIARETHVSRGAVHRILETLASEGYVSHTRGRYTVEPHLRILTAGLGDSWWLDQAQEAIEALCREVRWPISVVRPNALAVETCAGADSPFRHRVVGLGVKLPMVCSAAGRAYVAFLPENMRNQLIDVLAQIGEFPEDQEACRNPRQLVEMLTGIAQKGWTSAPFNRITVVAVPVLSPRGDVLGALSLRHFTASVTPTEVARLHLGKMQATARRIASGEHSGS